MNNLKLNFGQNSNYTRSQRREFERKFKKGLSKAKTIVPNDAFNRIQPELEKLGWFLQDDLANSVEIGNHVLITYTSGLKLSNEIFNITLISHENGIEISRLVVREEFQNQGLGGKFLDNLLVFLNRNGIMEIYVIPGIVGFGKYNQSHSNDQNALERFYKQRSFLKQERNQYWKLNVNSFLSFCTIESVDQLLLSGLIPKTENS